jgi:hypothetical protein
MAKFTAFDVPPLGPGLVTVTAEVPDEAMAGAGMTAVNCVVLTNVAEVAIAPKLTIEAPTKFVPLIIRVKAPLPATALLGAIVVIDGVEGVGGG